jgi:hypothetical protein
MLPDRCDSSAAGLSDVSDDFFDVDDVNNVDEVVGAIGVLPIMPSDAEGKGRDIEVNDEVEDACDAIDALLVAVVTPLVISDVMDSVIVLWNDIVLVGIAPPP